MIYQGCFMIMIYRCCDYRYVLWIMTKSDAINRLNNSKLDSKGTL